MVRAGECFHHRSFSANTQLRVDGDACLHFALLVPKLCTTYPSTCHQMCFWRAWYVFRKGLHLICHFSILVLEDFEWGTFVVGLSAGLCLRT